MSELVEMARTFAIKAHGEQVRRNRAKEPYAVHLGEVAALVKDSGGSECEIAAAWLHDVVEDTDVTLDEIREKFGTPVAEVVDGLTDPEEFSNLPLQERKVLQAKRLRFKGSSVKRVKIADQISNVRCVAKDPPIEWDNQKCLIYAETAFLIAMECGYISEFLNVEFHKAYNDAVRVYLPGKETVVEKERVLFYEGSWYCFSNFASFKVFWRGVDWMTSEHAYQAAKFTHNPEIFKMIRDARSAHDAKKIAKRNKNQRLANWQEIKLGIMEEIVRAKLGQQPYILGKLLETGDKEIVENSPTDSFWGRGPDWQGQNHLGKIWMKLREEMWSKTYAC